jgi:transcriptional regulator with GAF, ATPase, and Fis domain
LIRQIATPGLEHEWPSREELYYPLHVFPIVVPSLREQTADDPLLVRHFVHTYAQHRRKRNDTIPAEALDALTGYPYPGNVRQLQNLIKHAGHQDHLLTPVDYLHYRPPAARSPQRPADPTVESHARPICGSCRRGANQGCRGRRVEQERLFQNEHGVWS